MAMSWFFLGALDVMYNFDNMEILVKVDGFERVSKLYVWEGELVEVIGK